MSIDEEMRRRAPLGWAWSLYGATETFRDRCVLISPDYRVQIGREAESADEAIALACKAAEKVEKQ